MKKDRFTRHVILTPGSLGVSLMCTGVLELYKESIIDKPLHVLAYHYDFFENLDFIDKIHPITKNCLPIDGNLFEEVIKDSEYRSTFSNLDWQPHRRPHKKHITQLLAEKIGLTIDRVKPIVRLRQEEDDRGKEYIQSLKLKFGEKPIVYLGIESSTPNKDWKLENWKNLVKDNKDFLTFISFDQKANLIQYVTKIDTTKRQLLSILKHVDACVTVDSFPLHGASAKGINTPVIVCILGSSHPDVVCYEDTIVLYKQRINLECQPCGRPYSLFDKAPNGKPWECGHVSCLMPITVEDVSVALWKGLKNKEK